MDKLIINFHDLCKKMLSNKNNQGVGITRMEEAFVPCEYGMEVTCHMDLNSYGQ